MSNRVRHPDERDETTENSEQADEQTDVDASEEGVCPECGGALVEDDARAEVACTECGLVVEADQVDRGPEWRAFDSAEKDEKSRVGAPTTKMLHDEGLSTNIGWQDKDAYGNSLSNRQRQKMQRLRTWNERFRTRDSKERNLKQALGEIDRMASALGLPENVRETASVIYRRALDENLLPGRSIEGIATASLYAAVRMASVPRSLDDVAATSRIEAAEFKRAYRYIQRELGLEIDPTRPERFVPRLTSEVDASDEVERRARDLLDAGREANVISGKSPVGLAAAAVYASALLSNEKVTQDAIGDAADVSEVTIRNRYKELLDAQQRTSPDGRRAPPA